MSGASNNSQKNGAGMPLEGPTMKKTKVEPSAPALLSTGMAVAPTPAPVAATYPTQQQLLQQQIQQQLQQQLQAQLQAAAAKGQQAHITPAQIQAQAQAMVQAAAQAQAVVAAAKSRGDGLVPMNSAQIAALSQIQAQAIVHARPSTALIASGASATGDAKAEPTPAQIQNQIQLQAQALIHAHTQAQIAAGIYKGNNTSANNSNNNNNANHHATHKPVMANNKAPAPVAVAPKTTTYKTATLPLTATQIAQQSNTTTRQAQALQQLKTRHQAETDQSPSAKARQAGEWQALLQAQKKELQDLEKTFARQNAAAEYAGVKRTPATTTGILSSHHSSMVGGGGPSAVSSMGMTSSMTAGGQGNMSMTGGGHHAQDNSNMGEGLVSVATSPEFFARLGESLSGFWTDQLGQISALPHTETEQDFKNHNDLPLARIKRIMKSDEDVRMISAEAPVLFAKACEVFILELTLRSWAVSQHNKRRTLQKEDIREAIVKTDVFDFLVDVIH